MHSFSLPLIVASLCLAAAACTDEPVTEATTTATPTTTTAAPIDATTSAPVLDSTGPEELTTDPSTTDDGGTTTTGPSGVIFDIGTIPDSPPFEFDTQCGQVDFLFVIDNSGSMFDEQAGLIANFPAFINGIQTVLETVESYQVGVVTTDNYGSNIAGCNGLSSLVVQTSTASCGPYAEGNNYMTELDDLASTFSCAALVGTSGSGNERAMQAMVEAVQRVEGGPGQCNDGFIRDDALLVIVVITDEPESASLGTPMTWYQDVLAAKLGIPENVVVVSIINTPAGGCSGGTATNMAAFTDMWNENGFQVPICAPDYAPFFDEAVGIIDVACENYVPPA